MFRTVIRNLLSNAIKFSYQGSNVTIKTKSDTEGNTVISVSDQGTGMSKEEVDSIWDPATKISRPGTESESGTGFGLVVSKDFVTALGGTISVESRPEKGSTFTIIIPPSNPGSI